MNVIKLPQKKRRVLERDIQAAIRKHVNRLPGVRIVRNNTGTLRDIRDVPITYGLGDGSPDLVGVIVVEGLPLTFAIEVKAPGKKPSPAQRAWHRFARKWGITVIVAHTVEYAMEQTRALQARYVSRVAQLRAAS